jgi:hypothetical protein
MHHDAVAESSGAAAATGGAAGSKGVTGDSGGASSNVEQPPAAASWLPRADASVGDVNTFVRGARCNWLNDVGGSAATAQSLPPLTREVAGQVQTRMKQWVTAHPALKTALVKFVTDVNIEAKK